MLYTHRPLACSRRFHIGKETLNSLNNMEPKIATLTMPRNRHYALDLLKTISMLMVVILHVNHHCDYWKPTDTMDTATWWVSVTSVMICSVAVNVYALITGYVSVNLTWKLSRYVNLWMIVAFYTVTITGLAYFWMGSSAFSLKNLISQFTPIPFAGAHWFFTAYSILFFLMPFLNKGIAHTGQKYHASLVIFIIAVLPILNLFGGHIMVQIGLNSTWLVCMYIVVAYVKKYPLSIRKRYLLILYTFVLLLQISLCFFIRPGMTSYAFPLLVMTSLCVFLMFEKLQTNKKWFASLVPFIFSVYIIHQHPYIVPLLEKICPTLAKHSYSAIMISTIIFAVCIMIDILRSRVFSLLKLNKVGNFIGNGIQERVSAILSRYTQS